MASLPSSQHAANFLTSADQVVVLQDGKVLEQGPPNKIQVLSSIPLDSITMDENEVDKREPEKQRHAPVNSTETSELTCKIERKFGDFSIYAYYFRAAGLGKVSLYFACLFIAVFCFQFPSEPILHTPN